MAAGKGKDVLLKVGNGAYSETFATVAGLRTASLTLNNQAVDITTKDSAGWTELLEAAGISNVSISASGVFKDAASEETVRGYAQTQTINNFEFVFANGDKMSGAFLITSYERSGGYDDAEVYSISMSSSGAVTFTAA